MGNTLIQISDETWKQLNDYKTPKDKTFEEVIKRFLNNNKKQEVKEDVNKI